MRFITDLCRSPRWQIDHIDTTAGSVNVSGWALPFHDGLAAGAILMNGRQPADFRWSDSPDMHARYPYLENAARCRFVATYEVSEFPEFLRFSYVGDYTNDPFNRWTDIYFPYRLWTENRFIAPSESVMKRTQDHNILFRYAMYGTSVAMQMESALQTYFGAKLRNYANICDWGVGCGRLAQVVRHLAPGSHFIGLDVDKENVAWPGSPRFRKLRCDRNFAADADPIAIP